jgi:hypothetical protein
MPLTKAHASINLILSSHASGQQLLPPAIEAAMEDRDKVLGLN